MLFGWLVVGGWWLVAWGGDIWQVSPRSKNAFNQMGKCFLYGEAYIFLNLGIKYLHLCMYQLREKRQQQYFCLLLAIDTYNLVVITQELNSHIYRLCHRKEAQFSGSHSLPLVKSPIYIQKRIHKRTSQVFYWLGLRAESVKLYKLYQTNFKCTHL